MAWGGLASLLRRRVRERETRRRRGERRHASARRVGHCFGAADGLASIEALGLGLRPARGGWAAAAPRVPRGPPQLASERPLDGREHGRATAEPTAKPTAEPKLTGTPSTRSLGGRRGRSRRGERAMATRGRARPRRENTTKKNAGLAPQPAPPRFGRDEATGFFHHPRRLPGFYSRRNAIEEDALDKTRRS